MNASALVIQLGGRMRYAVPRILQRAGRLEHFHTDITGDRGWPVGLKLLPSVLRPHALRRLLQRRIEGIPAERVTAHAVLGLKIAWRERSARNLGELAAAHVCSGHELCRGVLRAGFGEARIVGAIGTSSEPLLSAARGLGLATFKEEIIAPPVVEREILAFERSQFSGWEEKASQQEWYERFEAVGRREWALSDLIVCGSEFVRESVKRAGGPYDRCVVVPYGVDLSQLAIGANRVSAKSEKLRVVTIGTINLRKGAPYVLEAARALKGRADFCWIGGSEVSGQALDSMRACIEITGHLPRAEAMQRLSEADVFLLPSLCEGSATVCYEAMALGVPVITTPNAGAVVRDGEEGFVVPIRDVGSIVARLELLMRDRTLLAQLAGSAKQRAHDFTIERYAERFMKALDVLSPKLPAGSPLIR